MPPHAIGESTPGDRRANIAFALGLVLASAASLSLLPASPPPSGSPRGEGPPPHEAGAAGAVRPSPLAAAAAVLTPAEALAAMRTQSGVRVQVAAHEPMVSSPVVGAFDERGRLWVGEMRTYMRDLEASGEAEPKNRLLVLEDIDRDGVFEKSTVFLDGINTPRGVVPCRGGVLLLEPPAIYFCRDDDGDGDCDTKTEILGGFTGLDNPEHAPNSLVLGLDNWYHVAQHNVEFRFDGEHTVTRPTPSVGQWGMTQDSAGRLLTTPNSDPLLLDLGARHYGARHANQGPASFVGRSIVPDKSVYPIHATPGVNRGYQPGTLRDDRTLKSCTAACGPAWYDSDALGEGFRSSAFVCEPAGNVVKRYVFSLREGVPLANNPYPMSEFIASTDERFRPVNTVVGPDGALYILDMYRGVIQHKLFLTPYLRGQIAERGLAAPVDCGRIYRLSREGGGVPPSANLASATDGALVELLGHADQWWRLTAQRLLVERRAVAQAERVRELSRRGPGAAARLHAYWTLEGLGALSADDVVAAMKDGFGEVRAAGARLGESMLAETSVWNAVLSLVDDADGWVRMQAVCTLGELPPGQRIDVLARIAREHAADRFTRDAIISGAGGIETALLAEFSSFPEWSAGKEARGILDALADCLLRGTPANRSSLAALTARLISDMHPAGEILLNRIRVAQRLDSDKPRPIMLDGPPARWASAMADRFNTLAEKMGECEVYFDWPDRPPVRRVHGTRPLTTSELAQFERGRSVYSQSCVSCHQGDGRGSSGLAPSLAASPIAEGDPERLATILIHGLEGTWKIGDLTYEAAMPPTPIKDDADLAAAMTFVRRSFGNAAEPVTAEQVAAARRAHAARTKAWSRAEVERAAGVPLQSAPSSPAN